jgi:acetate CoA/acetoacetate CoA-transferase alpha subunit
MRKIIDAEDAARKIKRGDAVLIGGFLENGAPENIIKEMVRQGQKDLTVICNDGGYGKGAGSGSLVATGQVKKFISSWIGYTPIIGELYDTDQMELELIPQGTLVERIRAGGFGLGGVLTPTGLGTLIEEKWGKRVHVNDKDYLYHTPLRGNVAIVEAYKADNLGNLKFRRSQRNFSQIMCLAADIVIASIVNPIEPAGNLDPDEIDVPHVVVDYLVPQKGVLCNE